MNEDIAKLTFQRDMLIMAFKQYVISPHMKACLCDLCVAARRLVLTEEDSDGTKLGVS